MRKTALLLAFVAAAAWGQPNVQRHPPKYTVATAPPCSDGEPKIYFVTDGNSSTDCSVGGSTTEVLCQCKDGSVSVVAGGGGGSSNSFETINAPSGTDPVAESSTDTLNITCAGGLSCTGDASTDTLALSMGTASLATALAANGANCSAGQFPLGVDASGAVESCSTSLSGNASTATALAANGANCSAGQYPLGVDASGAAESCTADDTGTDDQTATEVNYTPTTGTDWVDPDPTTAGGGLDALASRLTTEEAKADDDVPESGDFGALALTGDVSSSGLTTTIGSDKVLESMLKAVDAANDEECLTYETTTGDFEWQSCDTTTYIGGSTGATDNSILRADGVGGSTLQASPVTIDDTTGAITGPASQTWGLFTGTGSALRINANISTSPGYITLAASTYTQLVIGAASSTIGMPADIALAWGSSNTSAPYGAIGTPDTGLARDSAGVIRCTNGSTGICSGFLTARSVEANTAGSGTPNTLAATESWKVLTNEGATAANYEALPTAVAGYVFTFVVQDADGIRVVASAGDTIQIGATTSTSGGYCESTTIGDSITLVSVNASQWFATSYVGSGFSCS